LHRYLSESDFRYIRRTALGYSDLIRAEELIAATAGKPHLQPHW
jgi:hypothetical protein